MNKIVTKSIGLLINIMAYLAPKWSTNYAFELLCKVRRVGFSEKGQAFIDTAVSIPLENGDHNTVLHKWGTGEKNLLFLHGWMSNSQRWLPYVERLDLQEYTVYALDAPGHGMSRGNSLNLETYRQGVVKAIARIGEIDTLISHSFGGMAVCYSFLENKAIPVDRYVIMGAPSGMNAIFVYFKELLSLNARSVRNLNKKIELLLKVPSEEITVQNFFKEAHQPILVIHEVSDAITPIDPIKKAVASHVHIETYFTEGQDHNLKGDDTIKSVINFIDNYRYVYKRV